MPYLLLQIFTEQRLEWVWRLTLGLGAVFPLLILFVRLSMEEPKRYKENSMSQIKFTKLPWALIFSRSRIVYLRTRTALGRRLILSLHQGNTVHAYLACQ